jgi:hypothetical protein
MKKRIIIFAAAFMMFIIPCLGKDALALALLKINIKGVDFISGNYGISFMTSPSMMLTVYKNKKIIHMKRYENNNDASTDFSKYLINASTEQYTAQAKTMLLKSFINIQEMAVKLLARNTSGTWKGIIIAGAGTAAGFTRMGSDVILVMGEKIEYHSWNNSQQRIMLKEIAKGLNMLSQLPTLQSYLGL